MPHSTVSQTAHEQSPDMNQKIRHTGPRIIQKEPFNQIQLFFADLYFRVGIGRTFKQIITLESGFGYVLQNVTVQLSAKNRSISCTVCAPRPAQFPGKM